MEVFNDGTYINNHYTIHVANPSWFQKRTTVRVTRANTTQRVQVSTKISFVTVRRAFKARTAAKVNNMAVFSGYMYTFMYVHVVLLRGCNILSFRLIGSLRHRKTRTHEISNISTTKILNCFVDIHVYVHVYLN